MENQDKNFFTSVTGITIIGLFVLCCCCLILLVSGLGGMLFINSQATPTKFDTTPTPVQSNSNPSIPADITPTPFDPTMVPAVEIPVNTLETLETSIVPDNDRRDLACRFYGKCNISETLSSGPYKEGDQLSFWLTNPDNDNNFQVQASLKYVTPHAYFWVQDGVRYKQAQAKRLVDAFENQIYPTDREFFGSEWTPGVDNDPHIYILYARGIGRSVGGYFSAPDEDLPDAYKYSNAHEMFVFSADNSPLDRSYTFGTLAHEFQHMIHWKQDPNESTWMNEGFSELAAVLNHYSIGSHPLQYVANTDLQLTDWGPETGTNGPHYGASFLFLAYFLDRFGEDATKALVNNQQNGLESMDEVLKSIGATDKITGKAITADDVFMDWAVTNYLLDGSVSDGRYVYRDYPEAPPAPPTETISECPAMISRTVHQYGVDYIQFNCSGEHTLKFEGPPTIGLTPVDAYSGKMAFWSNMGDSSDMTLTHEFDFTKVTGPLSLKYRIWYDLEKNYDYAYLEASTDGGKSWVMIKTPSGTEENPTGGSYGWGYTGQTGNWIEESVDLSQFKGKDVILRFEYVTDETVNGDGLLLDDISIPEINYFTDFETDDGGWEGQGFVRIENVLPQKFELVLINQNGKTEVTNLELGADQTAEINVDLTDATLVVSGITRFTREEASYNITVK